MIDFMIQQYRMICEASYYPFEVYHVHAVNSLLSDLMSNRDIQMLVVIAKSHEPVTPTLLTDLFYISSNALSNRLTFFESHNYIRRQRSNTDTRQVHLTIQPEGQAVVNRYDGYVKAYIAKVRKSVRLFDYQTLLTAFQKILNVIRETKGSLKNQWDMTKEPFNSLGLIEMNKYFDSFDYDLIEGQQLKLKLRDLFILNEIYLFVYEGNSNLKQLSEKVLIPYQTLISKVNKFLSDEILIKDDEGAYQVDPVYENILHKFMLQRIIVYYKTLNLLTPKEQTIVLRLFKLLKDHAMTYPSSNPSQ